MRIRVATRGSALALCQADRVSSLLVRTLPGVEVEVVIVETTGDRDKTTPLEQMGGLGVFVKEVQLAVLDHRADLAVHSAKDLPGGRTDGLSLAAVPERADPRDVLVGCRLTDLPEGATIATGSIRRRAHLANHRPDLRFTGLRGNIGTRLEKAREVDAAVMAKAALDRLGLCPEVVDPLDPAILLPQVGQGALAVECRADYELLEALEGMDDPVARRAVEAERAFLVELGTGCDLPIAAHARPASDDHLGPELTVTGAIASPDGAILVREERTGTDGPAIGHAIARHLLDERGGAELMAQS
ncbi:MAG: hydroxymethylbilane synthase [Acidimicrobiales bacterium]|nr:hydroxymethylbilane synthase [Acidimicrobiales bacterium]MDP7116768.1 hydroxymethylbilane synthase [Acidimicrobiales bacterium]MEE1521287.1 hydroxymethylbilane synthase [Acidimicrobiales bacterium]